ncbi:site-specific integrase [Amycolatopsis sp. WAC 01376]|uniref:site-specific integrase n=1 Tax=Amycolatopsis sp. WAC 01376 TaxID=2203195 RepID=UPI0013150BBE|nr:site-specific integrase [Amycolatopsis sp. WAC 01376]
MVFTNDKGGLIDRAKWNPDVWHPAIQAAELAKGGAHGIHNLRHYYASRLIEGGPGHRGASMEQVRDYMGHASIVTTSETYGHLFEQAHERARSWMTCSRLLCTRCVPPKTGSRVSAGQTATGLRGN